MAVETTFRVVSATSQTVSFAPGDIYRLRLECAKCGVAVSWPTSATPPSQCPGCRGTVPIDLFNAALKAAEGINALAQAKAEPFALRLEVRQQE